MRMFAAALVASTVFVSPAMAQVLTTDLATWQAVAGPFTRDTDYGTEFDDISSLALDNGPTLSFGDPVSIRTIGSGWATWSGGYTGQVLATTGSSITVNLSPTVDDFGFFAEPNSFDEFLIRLTLDDGSSVQQLVVGDSGARFFGWNGGGVASFTISTVDDAFAFGDFYYTSGAIPEPTTWAMMIGGFGVVGGALRRRQRTTVSFA